MLRTVTVSLFCTCGIFSAIVWFLAFRETGEISVIVDTTRLCGDSTVTFEFKNGTPGTISVSSPYALFSTSPTGSIERVDEFSVPNFVGGPPRTMREYETGATFHTTTKVEISTSTFSRYAGVEMFFELSVVHHGFGAVNPYVEIMPTSKFLLPACDEV